MNIGEFAVDAIGGFVGLAAFLYYVSHTAEAGLSDAYKRRLGERLFDAQVTPKAQHAFELFAFAADRYFGRKLVSRASFMRSVALSLFWMACVGVAAALQLRNPSPTYPPSRILLSTAEVLPAILLIDFASVCMTRFLVRWSLPKGGYVVIYVAVLDLILSVLFFWTMLSLLKIVVLRMHGVGAAEAYDLAFRLDQLKWWSDPRRVAFVHYKGWPIYIAPEGIFFFSSLLASVWMWLYVIGYGLLAGAARIDVVKIRFAGVCNLRERPFFSIAVAMLVVGLVATTAVILGFVIMRLM
jgi:hypothetical protein